MQACSLVVKEIAGTQFLQLTGTISTTNGAPTSDVIHRITASKIVRGFKCPIMFPSIVGPKSQGRS